jgi:hypothetical protein
MKLIFISLSNSSIADSESRSVCNDNQILTYSVSLSDFIGLKLTAKSHFYFLNVLHGTMPTYDQSPLNYGAWRSITIYRDPGACDIRALLEMIQLAAVTRQKTAPIDRCDTQASIFDWTKI